MDEEVGLYMKHQSQSDSGAGQHDALSSALKGPDSITSKSINEQQQAGPQDPAQSSINTTRSTSTTSPVPAGGVWGGYLRRTLAQVEQQIDKVLLDDNGNKISQTTNGQDSNASISSPVPTRPSPMSNSTSYDPQRSSTDSIGRLPMQERLAAAVSKSKTGSRNSQTLAGSNPRVSVDQIPGPQPEPLGNDATESPSQVPEILVDNGNPEQTDPHPESESQEQINSQSQDNADDRQSKSLSRGRSSDSIRSQQSTKQTDQPPGEKSGSASGLRSIFKSTQLDSSSTSNFESRIADKEEKIRLLIEEGERMSKTELKHMNTIKKLRAQERQTRDENDHVKQQMEKLRKEIDVLKDSVKKLTEQNREQSDKLKSLTKMEQDFTRLRKERDELMVSNKKTRQQLAEAVARAEAAVSEAQADALETERANYEKLRQQLTQAESEKALAGEIAAGEASRLEARLDREMKSSQAIQSTLQKENAELEMQLENARSKVEELSSTSSKVSQARLLRQVESLQSQHADASANWREIEESLNTRITRLETERDEAVNKFMEVRKRMRESENKTKSLSSDFQSSIDRISRLESKLALREDTIKDLEMQLSEGKQRIRILDQACESERENSREAVEEIRSTFRQQQEEYQELQDQYRQMQTMVQQFQQHQNTSSSSFSLRSPGFARRVGSISEDLMDWNARTAAATTSVPVSPNSPRIVSGRTSSNSGYPQRGSSANASASTSTTSLQQYSNAHGNGTSGHDDSFESLNGEISSVSHDDDTSAIVEDESGLRPFSSPVLNGTQTPSVSTTPGGRASNRANSKVGSSAAPVHLVERMGATVRRLESEMAASREEIARLKEQNADQQNEMVELLRHARDRDALGKQNEQLAKQIQDLQAREQTALEMLGEKSELASELQADLADVKTLYKSQIEELIEQLSQAKASAATMT